jgi:hypothetical protein
VYLRTVAIWQPIGRWHYQIKAADPRAVVVANMVVAVLAIALMVVMVADAMVVVLTIGKAADTMMVVLTDTMALVGSGGTMVTMAEGPLRTVIVVMVADAMVVVLTIGKAMALVGSGSAMVTTADVTLHGHGRVDRAVMSGHHHGVSMIGMRMSGVRSHGAALT